MNNIKEKQAELAAERITVEPLPTPAELKRELSLDEQCVEMVESHRRQVQDIVNGRDKRLLVVVGPCSLHCDEAAVEYARRLVELQKHCAESVLLVMRCYLEKPRTTVGWKGMLYDPAMDGSDDIQLGLRSSRSLLKRIIEAGAPIATEALNPIAFQYIEDLVCWSAIGARTTESQTHREMASAMKCAVGFKNGTDGSLATAVNSLLSSSAAHSYYAMNDDGRAAIVRSVGNPFGQLVLRGGKSGTNYDRVHVEAAKKAMVDAGLNPSVMIDCSHENSGKDHTRQREVVQSIVSQVVGGCAVIRGVMIESHIEEGRQSISSSMNYGQSITDACVGWSETEALIALLSQARC